MRFERRCSLVMIVFFLFFSFCPVSGVNSPESNQSIHDRLSEAKKLMNSGYYGEALIVYNNILVNNPENESAFNNKGVALLRLGRCNESVQIFTKLLSNNPESQNNLLNLVFAEGCDSDSGAAYLHANEGIAKYPDIASFWLARGILERKSGHLIQSLSDINQSVFLEPDNPELWYEKARTEALLGNYSQAYSTILIAENLSPQDVTIRYYRGVMEEQLNLVRDALDTYDRVTDENPNYTEAWYSKGSIYYNHNRPLDAITAYDQVLRLDPNIADAWFYRGLSLMTTGYINESYNSFDKAVTINPDNRLYRAYRDRIKTYSQSGINQQSLRYPLSLVFMLIIIFCLSLSIWKRGKM